MAQAQAKIFTFTELENLSKQALPEFLTLARNLASLKGTLDRTRETLNDSVQYNGKVLCILKRDWLTAREKKTVMVNKSFPAHYAALMGLEPHNKAESSANAYSAFVLAPDNAAYRISEDDYDNCTAEAIQQGSRVVSKVHDNKEHQAVADAAKILRVRPKKSIQMLRNICDRLQEKVENEGTPEEKKTLVYLTQDEFEKQKATPEATAVAEQATTLCKLALGAVSAELLSIAQTTSEPETARNLALLVVDIPQRLAMNMVETVNADGSKTLARRFTAEQLEAWARENMPPVHRTEETVRTEYTAALELVRAIEEQVPAETLRGWNPQFRPSKKKAAKSEMEQTQEPVIA